MNWVQKMLIDWKYLLTQFKVRERHFLGVFPIKIFFSKKSDFRTLQISGFIGFICKVFNYKYYGKIYRYYGTYFEYIYDRYFESKIIKYKKFFESDFKKYKVSIILYFLSFLFIFINSTFSSVLAIFGNTIMGAIMMADNNKKIGLILFAYTIVITFLIATIFV
jgi:hypothetical protein